MRVLNRDVVHVGYDSADSGTEGKLYDLRAIGTVADIGTLIDVWDKRQGMTPFEAELTEVR